MGCDIHTFIEIKQNRVWELFDWRKKYEDGTYEDGEVKYNYDGYFDDPFYIHRNYNLFAVLANVRNGRGFAGIPTGSGFKPIDYPRGLPDDVTTEVEIASDRYGVDGHSHSYLTIKELLDYDWDGQVTTQYGVVEVDEYKVFKQNGKPNSWSGDISGGMVRKVSNEEMDNLIAGNSELLKTLTYCTTVKWTESYRDAVGPWWFKTLDKLAELGSPDDVRLVFWFDN